MSDGSKRPLSGSLRFKGSGPAAPAKNPTASLSANTAAPQPPKKTAAELAFEKAQQQRQAEAAAIAARKSHKEKVAEYNEYLGKLSEHHDIPKVGPG
jgi:protein FAM32A